MKLSLSTFFNSLSKFAYQKVLRHSFSSRPSQTVYSTNGADSLYRRISPVGDPKDSVVPVLDQWVKEGRKVTGGELQRIIKELKVYKRYKHALEISQWMTDKRYIPLSPGDTATRLNLIYRVHGIEKAENYFNNIPLQLKGFDVYVSLLSCYAHNKSVDKVEGVMQKLRDLGYATTPLSYNILMNLYYQMGNWERLDDLMLEMEGKGIFYDKYTLSIRLSAYAAALNNEGIDKIVERIESDPHIIMDSDSYSVAAHGYLQTGLVDKALSTMKKLEGQIVSLKKRSVAFDYLLRLYAEAGKMDEVYRVWNLYKKRERVFNKGYIAMLSALMKFNDIEGAEKVFEEWETRGLSYDFRLPNFLIDAYCRNGRLAKAEVLLNDGISKGGKPSTNTWYYLAGGYIQDNQVPEAVEALTQAILECPPNWKPGKETLVTCLDYLKGQGDVKEAEKFIQLLKVEGIFSAGVHDRLLNIIKDGIQQQQE